MANQDQLRSTANRANYAAQYIAANKHNDQPLRTIAKFFTETESGLQPLTADIAEKLQYGTDASAIKVLFFCAKFYAENSKLINSWLNR